MRDDISYHIKKKIKDLDEHQNTLVEKYHLHMEKNEEKEADNVLAQADALSRDLEQLETNGSLKMLLEIAERLRGSKKNYHLEEEDLADLGKAETEERDAQYPNWRDDCMSRE